MIETELASAVERLMGRVDYYLHCALDEEYDHASPAAARIQLEAAMTHELQRASAIGLVSAISESSRTLRAGLPPV
jgi:hypothetical protein